jgi:hypothetical protein
LGTPLLVIPAAGADGTEPDFIAVNEHGASPVYQSDGAMTWTLDLISLTTGEKVGTLDDRATCSTSQPPPCAVLEVITTYHLPGGDVASRGQWSSSPDPARPGFYFTGSRPTSNTIVSATGRFAGRTGRVTGWGSVDNREFPAKIGLDVFTIIRFNPTGDEVLGRRELFAGQEPAGRPRFHTEYVHQREGVDESSDPTRFEYTTPLFSLSDGTLKGSVVDSMTCGTGPPPCLVFDVTTVLRYPDGEVTLRHEIPVAPDPGRPGFFHFGTRPSSNRIVSSTGAYAGRTGWLAFSGSVDMRRSPDPMPFEGIGMLVLAD